MNAALAPLRSATQVADRITNNNNIHMNASLDNFLFEREPDSRLSELFRAAAAHVRDLGFDLCAYHVRFPLPISSPKAVQLDNYPCAWSQRYRALNYQAIDPTLAHAQHYASPLVWSEQVFTHAPALWDDMQANGIKVGWAHPVRCARNLVGVLTAARSEGEICSRELREKQAMLAWAAQTAHMEISRYLAPRFMPSVDTPLSQREIDVLRWTADGKTASEISAILAISERTVNYHANNAVVKLGVANKTAAAAHAALLGLL